MRRDYGDDVSYGWNLIGDVKDWFCGKRSFTEIIIYGWGSVFVYIYMYICLYRIRLACLERDV